MKRLVSGRLIFWGIVLSLLIHGVGYLTTVVLQDQTPPPIERVSVEILEPQQPLANTVPEKDKVPDDWRKRQIVEQNEKTNNQVPTKADFLSAKNQKVEKETVAQARGDFKNVRDNGGKVGQQNEPPKPEAPQTPKKEAAKDTAEKPVKGEKAPSLKDLMPSMNDGDELLARKQEMEKSRTIVATQPQGDAPVAGDTSRTNDYLKKVNPGLETMLNTREFKYFTYYQRIRKQLSHYWEPKLKEKLNRLFKQGRKIASQQDRITKVLIVLNDSGTLVNVQVINESGVADLDDAAIEAFRAAAPFPNPPRGIVETDGTVKIRWDFIVES
mgnify:CR=1 FL=1